MADETTAETPETPQKKGAGALGWVAAVAGGAAALKPTGHFLSKSVLSNLNLKESKAKEALSALKPRAISDATTQPTAESIIELGNKIEAAEAHAASFSSKIHDLSQKLETGKWNNLNKIKVAWAEGGWKAKGGMIAIPIVTAVALGAIISKVRNRGHAEAVEAERAQAAGADKQR